MAMNNSPCSSMIVPALKAPFSHPGFCGLLTFISYLDPAGMLGHPVSWVLGSWTSGGPNWCCRSVSKYLAIAFGPSAATSADMVLRDPLKHSKKKAGKKWSPIVDMYLLTFSHKKIHVCYVFTPNMTGYRYVEMPYMDVYGAYILMWWLTIPTTYAN